MREIGKLLKIHGLQSDPVELLDFLQSGIELRELAKFHLLGTYQMRLRNYRMGFTMGIFQ